MKNCPSATTHWFPATSEQLPLKTKSLFLAIDFDSFQLPTTDGAKIGARISENHGLHFEEQQACLAAVCYGMRGSSRTSTFIS